MTPVLEVSDLCVAYGSAVVLDGVDLSVDAGEIVALLGTNGAGKSTLLRAVSGVLPVRRGRVRLAGADVTRMHSSRRVARGLVHMPGGRATFPGLTVDENLRVAALALRGVDATERLAAALDRFPVLAQRRRQLAGTMSGGQQQILALARALLARPRVLMIDELSLGLAPAVVEELLSAVVAVRAEGVGVVVVEQQVDLALDIADRAYFLERGQVRFSGPAEGLRGRSDLLRAVFLAGTAAG
jgi:branched-chain amino acid transport system ATP-binding protein